MITLKLIMKMIDPEQDFDRKQGLNITIIDLFRHFVNLPS